MGGKDGAKGRELRLGMKKNDQAGEELLGG